MSFSRSKTIVRLRRFAETMLAARRRRLRVRLRGDSGRLDVGRDRRVSRASALRAAPCTCRIGSARGLFILIGISLGSAVTPETVEHDGRVAAEPAGAHDLDDPVTASVIAYLRFVHRWDGVSTRCSARCPARSPGDAARDRDRVERRAHCDGADRAVVRADCRAAGRVRACRTWRHAADP